MFWSRTWFRVVAVPGIVAISLAAVFVVSYYETVSPERSAHGAASRKVVSLALDTHRNITVGGTASSNQIPDIWKAVQYASTTFCYPSSWHAEAYDSGKSYSLYISPPTGISGGTYIRHVQITAASESYSSVAMTLAVQREYAQQDGLLEASSTYARGLGQDVQVWESPNLYRQEFPVQEYLVPVANDLLTIYFLMQIPSSGYGMQSFASTQSFLNRFLNHIGPAIDGSTGDCSS